MKKVAIIFSLLFAGVTFTKAQDVSHALDGRKYAIEIFKDNKLDSKETLVFEKGMMDPLDCHQYGFSATPYQAKNVSGRVTFATYSKSETEGNMGWQGTVSGDKIEGSLVWSKEGQERISYTFLGTLIPNTGK